MNFNQRINRRGIAAQKWDDQNGEFIPMWVADMDFPIPEKITEVLQKRVDTRSFGFSFMEDSVYQAVIDYYKNRYHTQIEKEWIVWIPSVMPGANLACRMAGGKMLYNMPMYPHIRRLHQEAHTEAVEVWLSCDESGRYTVDWEAMEAAVTEDVHALVLCNPHNPVGRVFTREELEEYCEFCRKHNLLMVSDEIHCDLVYEGEHIPYFTLNEYAREHSVTLTSPSKTYNIPAIPYAFAIVPNEALRKQYQDLCCGLFPPLPIFSAEALRCAYAECEDWRLACVEYLKDNRDYTEERIAQIPGLSMTHNEATYLGWIDCRGTGLADPWTFFREKAGVNYNDGRDFGAPGFVRINWACPREQLKDALDRTEEALRCIGEMEQNRKRPL